MHPHKLAPLEGMTVGLIDLETFCFRFRFYFGFGFGFTDYIFWVVVVIGFLCCLLLCLFFVAFLPGEAARTCAKIKGDSIFSAIRRRLRLFHAGLIQVNIHAVGSNAVYHL
jgi:hypothetical protein